MTIFERYLFFQQLKPFAFFSVVLVGILWLIQALPKLDYIISNGQSGLVFIDISLLLLPQVMFLVLPLAAFASTLYAIHKLTTETELLIFMGAGASNLRLIKPVVFFGGAICSILFYLSLYLVPLTQHELRSKLYDIRQEFSNRLVKDQIFFHPIKGVTIYIRESSEIGEIKGIFITDARQKEQIVTYSAKEALMSRSREGLILVMQNGLLQVTDAANHNLTTLKFNRLGFQLDDFLPTGPRKNFSPKEISPLSILSDPDQYGKDSTYSKSEYISEAHLKLATPFGAIALTLLALGVFLNSGFTRNGYFTTIITSILAAVIVQALTSAFRTVVINDQNLFWILYVPTIACILFSLLLIVLSNAPLSKVLRSKLAKA